MRYCSHEDTTISSNCFGALRYLCGGDRVWEIIVGTLPGSDCPFEGQLLFDNVKHALKIHGHHRTILVELFGVFEVLTTLDADDDTDDAEKLEALKDIIVEDRQLVQARHRAGCSPRHWLELPSVSKTVWSGRDVWQAPQRLRQHLATCWSSGSASTGSGRKTAGLGFRSTHI